jgi:rhodanese-related sulfurtransferase
MSSRRRTELNVCGGALNDTSHPSPSFACAKALTWGFTRVYYFGGGLYAWNKAGYPVETAQ